MILFKAIKIWLLREKKLKEWKKKKYEKWLSEGRTPKEIRKELKLTYVSFWKTYKRLKKLNY